MHDLLMVPGKCRVSSPGPCGEEMILTRRFYIPMMSESKVSAPG
jgi:hypothetical protein